jgi:hypothetical protein
MQPMNQILTRAICFKLDMDGHYAILAATLRGGLLDCACVLE